MSWLPTIVTSQPSVEPVLIADARSQVRLASGDTSFDDKLNALITAARSYVEQYTGTKLINQTVSLRCSSWSDLEHLPTAPVSAVDSLKYLDVNGVEQTLDPAVYEEVLTGLSGEIRLAFNQSWPPSRVASDAIRIVATAGYGTAGTDVPASLNHAMLRLIEQWFDAPAVAYDMRGVPAEMPHDVTALLANFRVY